jgi:hypothetical protein
MNNFSQTLQRKMAYALIDKAKSDIATGTDIGSLFMGLELIQKFHALPLSVVETFERCATHAVAGREEQANALLSTIRPDIVAAIGRIEEQLLFLERMEAATEKVTAK